ncbi:MAG TPA: serine hydrolase domain-containing protein [Acidimicrobiales bacterium]|nr:serine hydrolase domain-containing protein [Acidimicrobiales bacterium]
MPDAELPEGLSGRCDERFVVIAELLARQIASGAHHGAALSAYFDGKCVVDVWGGKRGPVIGQDYPEGSDRPWSEDTLSISFSTTKGVAATALHMAMERAGVDYDQRVVELWPEFGAHGKGGITIRHVLSHEAGIPQIRDVVPGPEAFLDYAEMIERIEALEPLWEPGTANGYHAVTFGHIVAEILRRIDGRRIDSFVTDEIAGPLGLDGCFIGSPASEHARVAPVVTPPDTVADDVGWIEALVGPDHLLVRALAPPGDMGAFLNSPEGLASVAPAFTGAFTARSLARLYACLERGGTLDGVTLLRPETLAEATTLQNKRPDLVLVLPGYWRLGYMGGGSSWSPAGPDRAAFGHNGLNGSVGLADPACGLSLGLTLDRVELNVLGSDRTLAMVQAAVAAAHAARGPTA